MESVTRWCIVTFSASIDELSYLHLISTKTNSCKYIHADWFKYLAVTEEKVKCNCGIFLALGHAVRLKIIIRSVQM